jgi:DNA repair photolyase
MNILKQSEIRIMEKLFKGKAIYQPKGRAGEYSRWACNFYKGCPNGCTYCFLKKGVLKHAMGGDTAKLKDCFKSPDHAIEVFQNELIDHRNELQQCGLFFTFSSDPFLEKTIDLTVRAIDICMANGIPVKLLTKRADWIEGYFTPNAQFCAFPYLIKSEYKSKIAFGFTLTGHDELEPGASPNAERIEAMSKLHDMGFKTFASIEPIIDFSGSLKMIKESRFCCDLFKIGLESGKKYDKNELTSFMVYVLNYSEKIMGGIKPDFKIYFKDTLLKQADISRDNLPKICVTRDYNLFK